MATNNELMSDKPELEALSGDQADVNEQALEDKQAFADTQPLGSGQAFADTQPLDDGQALADTQPLGDGLALADTQSLATVSSEQSALVDPDDEALAALKNLEAQRKKKRQKRTITIIAACAVVLALIGAWAVAQNAQTSQNELAASTAVVKRADLTSSIQTNGTIEPGSEVNVSPEVSGVIENVLVSDNQEVEAGTVLFTLRNKDIDDAIAEAQITLSRANRDLAEARADASEAQNDLSKAEEEHNATVHEEEAEERAAVAHAEKAYQETYDEEVSLIPEDATKKERKELIAEAKEDAQTAYDLTYLMESPGEISEFDDSMYVSSIESANSAVVSAEEYVSDLERSYNSLLEEADKRTVRAPVSGTVIDLLAVPGATVGFASGGTSTAKSDTLAKIADLSKISVDVDVSEVDIPTVAVGQRAIITFAAVPDLEIVGRVDSIASVASNVTSDISSMNFSEAVTFKVTIATDVSDERLKPGMSASVKILTKDVPNVLVVPAGAVEEEDGVTYVTVVKNNNASETEKRTVVVSDRTSLEVAIESGLKEGEVVIDRSANASSSSESSSSIGTR